MEEEAVTLFIQGHGREYNDETFNNDHTTKLLSFVGISGELGDANFCDYNGKTIDINVIDFLHGQYSNQYNNNGNLDNESQDILFDILPEYLQKLYKKCNINYENGFTKTWPRWEREFFFEPNPHENCRLCKTKNNRRLNNNYINGRCLPERNKNNLYCPEYGLTIVASSFPDDFSFTLAGSQNRTQSNMNMTLSSKTFWKNRASNQYKFLIDKIYDEKEITLTELNLLFKSMGFKYIYILDPTCRECEINKQEAERNRSIETTMPVFTNQPTTSIIPEINYEKSNINNQNPYIQTFQNCYNGVCGLFHSKSKIDGGRKRTTTNNKTKKVFEKRNTNKKKIIKTKNNLKKNNKKIKTRKIKVIKK